MCLSTGQSHAIANSAAEFRTKGLPGIRAARYVKVIVLFQYTSLRHIIGARGVTLTFSSGDGGVGDGDPDPATQECFTNDGRNKTEFLPAFPPSCPLYV